MQKKSKGAAKTLEVSMEALKGHIFKQEGAVAAARELCSRDRLGFKI